MQQEPGIVESITQRQHVKMTQIGWNFLEIVFDTFVSTKDNVIFVD